jgi:hypothetical protein
VPLVMLVASALLTQCLSYCLLGRRQPLPYAWWINILMASDILRCALQGGVKAEAAGGSPSAPQPPQPRGLLVSFNHTSTPPYTCTVQKRTPQDQLRALALCSAHLPQDQLGALALCSAHLPQDQLGALALCSAHLLLSGPRFDYQWWALAALRRRTLSFRR